MPDYTAEQMFELKLLFLRELGRGYREAREAQEQFLRASDDGRAADKLRIFFHQIAGTAHSVDMPILGHVAAIGERVADQTARGKIAGEDAAQIFSEALAVVAFVLDEHGAGKSDRPLDSLRPKSIDGMIMPEGIGEGRELSKILVVDDDRFSAGLIDSTLRSAGFMSSYCCDPAAALLMIEEELPDLIIMDVVMPEMDGFELCRRVRAHPALQFTPIIFVTRKGDVEQRVRGLEVGGNDYIAKPFEPQELVARVRSHLLRLASLREMAIRDGLTHCFNHKFFRMRLEQEVARARRYDHRLAVAMLDVDRFKRVNDQHGHAAGDVVLAYMASIITASVRGTDVVARYGGEEFAILMVHAGAKEADIICDRLRERIANHEFKYGDGAGPGDHTIPVTVSIGIAEFANATDNHKTLLQRADAALYEAKRAGRNRVTVADPE